MGPRHRRLIFELEDEFEVDFPETHALRRYTVAQLADLVHARLRQDPEEPCPQQQGLYIVRRQLMRRLSLPRSAVRPETRLEELFPRSTRPETWCEVVASLGRREGARAGLVRSPWLSRIVFLLLPALALLAGLALLPGSRLWLAALPAVVVAALAARYTARLKVEFPPGLSRVEDLLRLVGPLECKVWSREEVLERTRHLAAEAPGASEETAEGRRACSAVAS